MTLWPLLAMLLTAATPLRPAAFEVASIKPSRIWRAGAEGGSSRSKIETTPNRLTMENIDLNECIQWAYGAKGDQVSGPNLGGERYDILAKSAGPVPVNELKIMLQDLLAKRFQLVLRRDTKLFSVYELVVAKRGSKLPAPKAADDSSRHHAVELLPRVEDGSFVFQETSMTEFAEKLSMLRGVERPVLDRTGIKGYFDITLKGAATAVRNEESTLFAIVEEQLGLKLVPAKDPLEVLVIEHAEKPSIN